MVQTGRGETNYSEKLKEHLRDILISTDLTSADSGYNNLIQEIANLKHQAFVLNDHIAEFNLCNLIVILVDCVSYIKDVAHESLLSEIYTMPLWECSKDVRLATLNYMIHMSVMNSFTVQQILQVLVFNINIPLSLANQQEDIRGREWLPSNFITAIQYDIVATLEKILKLIPVSGQLLMPILARGFPHKLMSRPLQCVYLGALFKLAEKPNGSSLKEQIIVATIQHLTSLDVEICWQDICFSLDEEEEEREADDGDIDIFELEGQTGDPHLDEDYDCPYSAKVDKLNRGGFEGEETKDTRQEEKASTSGKPQVDETADKLDSMMELVFEFIEKNIDAGDLETTWNALKKVFFSTILNTHKSNLLQNSEKYCKAFLNNLMMTLTNSCQPDIHRVAAVAYVASFLARATFLSKEIVISTLKLLIEWCYNYCKRVDEESPIGVSVPGQQGLMPYLTPNSITNQVFYAACQALFYVICYRLEQLLNPIVNEDISDSLRSLFKDYIPSILNSKLHPLQTCLPTVVNEFKSLVRRMELLSDNACLDHSLAAERSQRPLEMYFPFDPYLLRRSAKFLHLKESYLSWKTVSGQRMAHHTMGDGSDFDKDSDTSSSLGSSENEHDAEVQEVPMSPNCSIAMGTSMSTTGSMSPPCSLTWTPTLVKTISDRHARAIIKPMDSHE